jgi:AcrR family transcriptional regulator
MDPDKTALSAKLPIGERVLDAAERLLDQSGTAFSMRELAEEAGVSFATPFNHFGSKAAIMLALSGRRIASMHQRLSEAVLPEKAVARILAAVDSAVSVMLAAPEASRAVMGAISAPSEESSNVSLHSSAFWAEALGGGKGLVAATRPLALTELPDQLAIVFRGVLSFWAAGEIPDHLLNQRAIAAAAVVLLGFAGHHDRPRLLALIENCDPHVGAKNKN